MQIRLIKNIQNIDTLPRSKSASRKWQFFRKSSRKEYHDSTALVQHADNTEYNVTRFYKDKDSLKNGKDIRSKKVRSHNRISKIDDENMAYGVSLDYNNNEVLNVKEKILCETLCKSTETKQRGLLTMISLSRFIALTTVLVYKKQPKPPDILKSNLLATKLRDPIMSKIPRNNYNYDNLRSSHERYVNTITDIHSLAKVQMKPKQQKQDSTNKDYSIINTYKLVKGIIKAIRLFVHNTNTNQIDSTNKKDNTNKIDEASTLKNMKPLDNSTPKDNAEREVTEVNKNKSKRKVSKEKNKKVRIKSSRHKLSEFHSFFSHRWKNVKSNIVFRTNKKTKSNIGLNEKKNHKRRKKRKDDISLKASNPKVKKGKKKDNKCTRNYRISAFLADHDWMKKDYNERDKLKKNTDDSCRAALPVCCRRLLPLNKNKLVAVSILFSLNFFLNRFNSPTSLLHVLR